MPCTESREKPCFLGFCDCLIDQLPQSFGQRRPGPRSGRHCRQAFQQLAIRRRLCYGSKARPDIRHNHCSFGHFAPEVDVCRQIALVWSGVKRPNTKQPQFRLAEFCRHSHSTKLDFQDLGVALKPFGAAVLGRVKRRSKTWSTELNRALAQSRY